MVVGAIAFVDRELNLTRRLYRPLVAAVLPEAAGVGEPCPISGFRAVRAARARAALPLPGGYGVETWLNLRLALAGARLESVEIGLYAEALGATVRAIGEDVRDAVLDVAAGAGRIGAAARRRWSAWADDVIEACAAGDGRGVLEPAAVSAALDRPR